MTEQPQDPQIDEPGDAEDVSSPAEGTAAAATGIDKAAAAAQAKAEAPATAPDDTAATAAADEPAPSGDVEDPEAVSEDEPVAERSPAAPAGPSPKPAPPQRRRDQPRPTGGAPVEVRAQAKYVRTSARKARLVGDHIRGKDVADARSILAFTPRAAAKPWSKLLESAVANAEHNHELVGDDLKLVAVFADEGPTLKRFQPRAMGRATRIRKRTSHLTIILTPKDVPTAGTRRGARRKGGR
jgi:ribosomal protein L22